MLKSSRTKNRKEKKSENILKTCTQNKTKRNENKIHMDLIDGYLKRENSFDLTDEHGHEISDDEKLEFFFNLFIDLEKNYRENVLELNRLNDEHKEEINKVNIACFKMYLFFFVRL